HLSIRVERPDGRAPRGLRRHHHDARHRAGVSASGAARPAQTRRGRGGDAARPSRATTHPAETAPRRGVRDARAVGRRGVREHDMNMSAIPFGTTDWSGVERTEHKGERGAAYWRTKEFGGIRVRMVEYTPGYLADHWCEKGHILLCIEGEL